MKYTHKVQYYETDRMGITHHSNYIRWMEEARVDLLSKIGLPYSEMERLGIGSPVVGLDIKYKAPSTFDDVIEIETRVTEYNGIRLLFAYTMRNAATGAVVVEANSSHCFVSGGRAVSLGRTFPDVHEKMLTAMKEQAENLK